MNDFIDRELGFYFDGGFHQMISDAELGEEEIQKWGSLAVLYNHCLTNAGSMSLKEKEDTFCIIEALYLKLEVDLMFGEIDKFSLDEVFEDYDIEPDRFKLTVEKGVELIEEHGLDLYKRINQNIT